MSLTESNLTSDTLGEDKLALEFTLASDSKITASKTDGSKNWIELIQNSNYNKALEELDSILNTDNFSVLERLWWIRCQLNLNLLPLTTLVSPLEEIYPQVIESKENSALAISTLFKTGKNLLDKNQSRLSALMLERAESINIKHKVLNPELSNELKSLFAKALEAEFKNAKDKKENIQYINEIEKKLEATKKISKKAEWTLSTAENSAQESSHKAKKTKDNKYLLKYAIILILLFFAGRYILNYSEESEAQIAISLALPESKPLEPSFIFAKNTSILSGVEKRLASLGETSSSSESSSETSSSAEIDSRALEQANKIEVPGDEELESISGSNSSEEQIPQTKIPRANIPSANIPQAKLPPLNPNNVSAARVETVEQSPGTAPSLPEILENEPRIPEGKTLDGKVLQSYEVEVFDPPLVYRTITGSEVLSAPSLLSKSLARLEVDTHIYVTKKMGLWVEIRSTGGKIGYIYAQDVEEIR